MLDWYVNKGGRPAPPQRTVVHQNYLHRTANSTAVQTPSDHIVKGGGVITQIIYYGRMEKRKGVKLFNAAVDLIHEKLPPNIVITYLGGIVQGDFHVLQMCRKWSKFLEPDEEEETDEEELDGDTVEEETSNEDLEEEQKEDEHPPIIRIGKRCVVLTDYSHQEALEYLRERRHKALVVIPSLMENSPFTVMESIANSIRFIATDVGGIPELIHADDRKKVLFKPSEDELAALLLHSLSGD